MMALYIVHTHTYIVKQMLYKQFIYIQLERQILQATDVCQHDTKSRKNLVANSFCKSTSYAMLSFAQEIVRYCVYVVFSHLVYKPMDITCDSQAYHLLRYVQGRRKNHCSVCLPTPTRTPTYATTFTNIINFQGHSKWPGWSKFAWITFQP